MLKPRALMPAELYEYPEHLRALVAPTPAAPGVYLLYGESAQWPLYIGKSINIRSRLLAHLRTADEARLLKQTQRIECIRTAGEVGALLLESRLIKERQPLFNKRLRHNKRLSSLQITADGSVEVVNTTALPSALPLYGLFAHRRAAIEFVRTLADEHGLCLVVMGLEKSAGRACFRQQIRKCRGACCGHESLAEHQQRLLDALAQRLIYQWPYAGAVALHESHDALSEYHVINQWHYLGSYSTLAAAQQAPHRPPKAFDADSYKILLRPLLSTEHRIIELL